MAENNENTTQASPSTGNVNEWEHRFAGLQTTLTRKSEEWVRKEAELKAELSAKDAEIRGIREAKTAADTVLNDLKSQLSAVMTERDSVKTDAATLKSKLDRTLVIAEKGLLADESQGLLRTDLQGDDLVKHLDAYLARTGLIKKDVLTNLMTGATPASAGGKAEAKTPAQLKQEMIQAFDSGDMDTYNAIRTELLKPE